MNSCSAAFGNCGMSGVGTAASDHLRSDYCPQAPKGYSGYHNVEFANARDVEEQAKDSDVSDEDIDVEEEEEEVKEGAKRARRRRVDERKRKAPRQLKMTDPWIPDVSGSSGVEGTSEESWQPVGGGGKLTESAVSSAPGDSDSVAEDRHTHARGPGKTEQPESSSSGRLQGHGGSGRPPKPPSSNLPTPTSSTPGPSHPSPLGGPIDKVADAPLAPGEAPLRKIPKLPMIEFMSKWYRGKTIRVGLAPPAM